MVVAAYRIAVQGWPTERAIADARDFGVWAPAQICFLRRFGADLAIWLRARYQGTRCGRRFRRRAPALGRRDVRPRAHGL